MLRASVEGPCLHRPGNWLVSQLNAEPKPVYKVRFIRRKERLNLEKCCGARKSVARCSGEGWGFYGRFNSGLGGFCSLEVDWRAFLVSTFIGGRNNLESILLISPVADPSDSISSLGCRNAGLHLLRKQE
jgi:hypothetical protein